MLKQIILPIFCLFTSVFFYSCNNGINEPTNNVTLRQPFTNGYSVYYGTYYDYLGIDAHVFELDLYTEGLGLDSTGQYVGTGQNLYMTDIFSIGSDSLLAEGNYTIDTLYQYTTGSVLGGASYGGIPGGALLINISTTGISYDYIISGTMTVAYSNDSTTLNFKLQTKQGTLIENQFRGILPQFNMSNSEDSEDSSQIHINHYKSSKKHSKTCFKAENRL